MHKSTSSSIKGTGGEDKKEEQEEENTWGCSARSKGPESASKKKEVQTEGCTRKCPSRCEDLPGVSVRAAFTRSDKSWKLLRYERCLVIFTRSFGKDTHSPVVYQHKKVIFHSSARCHFMLMAQLRTHSAETGHYNLSIYSHAKWRSTR